MKRHNRPIPNTRVSRPVRTPNDREARLVLARDLSRDKTKPHGYDQAKFLLLAQLPLFEVAVDGHEGMFAALDQQSARQAMERRAA